jgi:hypothetical protein
VTIVRNTIKLDAYALFDGTGTPSITKSSSNVTSVADTATGRYTLTFNALPSSTFIAVATAELTSLNQHQIVDITGRSTTTVSFETGYGTATLYDSSIHVVITGA